MPRPFPLVAMLLAGALLAGVAGCRDDSPAFQKAWKNGVIAVVCSWARIWPLSKEGYPGLPLTTSRWRVIEAGKEGSQTRLSPFS